MERREQYDPEDIEALLMERAFEELLPEERAFVLRHLKDADEYEAMRATLNALRNLHEDNEPVVADMAVRENVMAAFREQRRPRLQIWLNSVGALFIPGESRGFWMPSLRLASLAAVLGIGVWGLYRVAGGVQDANLAQLREVEKNGAPTAEVPMPGEAADIPEPASTMADSAPMVSNWSAQADASAQAGPTEESPMKEIDVEDLTFGDKSTLLRAEDEAAADDADATVALLDVVRLDSTLQRSSAPGAATVSGSATAQGEQLAEVAANTKKEAKLEADTRRERMKDLEYKAHAEAASSQALDAKLLTLQNAAW